MRKTIHDVLADAQARLRRLEPHEAAAAVAEGAVLVDIRTAEERARDGVVPGSLHVERNVLEWRVDPASGTQHPELAGREDRVVLICSEGFCTSLAAAALHELGFTGATDVLGGFEAWAAAGLPVVGDAEEPW